MNFLGKGDRDHTVWSHDQFGAARRVVRKLDHQPIPRLDAIVRGGVFDLGLDRAGLADSETGVAAARSEW